jgi:hypothetical protein
MAFATPDQTGMMSGTGNDSTPKIAGFIVIGMLVVLIGINFGFKGAISGDVSING